MNVSYHAVEQRRKRRNVNYTLTASTITGSTTLCGHFYRYGKKERQMTIIYDHSDNEWVLRDNDGAVLFTARSRDDCADEMERIIKRKALEEKAKKYEVASRGE